MYELQKSLDLPLLKIKQHLFQSLQLRNSFKLKMKYRNLEIKYDLKLIA